MIARRNGARKVKCRESLLLPRLVTVLKGVRVALVLANGTRIAGTVEAYGRDIKTLSIPAALAELHLAGELFGNLDDVLARNPELEKLYATYTHRRRDQRVLADQPGPVLLRDAEADTHGRKLVFSRLSVPDWRIATLVPEAFQPDPGGDAAKQAAKPRPYNLKRMVLDQHRDEIRNAAFSRCRRIGSNNIRQ